VVTHRHRLVSDTVHGVDGWTRFTPTDVSELLQRCALEGIARIEHEDRVIGAGTDLVDQGRDLGEGAPVRRPVCGVVEWQDGAMQVGGVENGQLGNVLAPCARERGGQHHQRQQDKTSMTVHLEAAILPLPQCG
jgi:hypothetical protein